jgi:hypothetical protein
MMTEQEAQALIQLLQRTPMTTAETLWISDLLDRLRQRPPTKRRADAQDEGQSQARET